MKISPVLNCQIPLKGQNNTNSVKSPSITDAYVPVKTKGLGRLKLYMFTQILTNPDIRKAYVEVRKKEGTVYEDLCTITDQSSKLQKQSKALLENSKAVLNEENNTISQMLFVNSKPESFFNKDTNTLVIVDDKHTTICKNPSKQPGVSTFDEMYIFEDARLKEYFTNVSQTRDNGISADEHFIFDDSRLSTYSKGYKKHKGCTEIEHYMEFDRDNLVSKYDKNCYRSANGIACIDKSYIFKGLGVISSYSENKKISEGKSSQSEVMYFDLGHLQYYKKFNPVAQSPEKELLFHNNKLIKITQNGITTPATGKAQ